MKMFARPALIAANMALSLALALALPAHAEQQKWVGAWAAAQLAPDAKNSLAPEDYPNATLRQVVRLSIGGDKMRVRLSNAFGTQPLTIKAARVAVSAALNSARIDPATDRPLTPRERPLPPPLTGRIRTRGAPVRPEADWGEPRPPV